MTESGTRKTFASVFAFCKENPRRALFIVYREQIAKQAIASYKQVFGETKSFGLLSGNSKNYMAEYLFTTMQMMTKTETLKQFDRAEFKTIVIGESEIIGQVQRRPILTTS